jgi:hypothetical protein
MSRKPLTLLGLALILAGVLALVYQGVSYTRREKVLDVGPFKASVDRHETIPLPPWLGTLLVAGGVAALLIDSRKGS